MLCRRLHRRDLRRDVVKIELRALERSLKIVRVIREPEELHVDRVLGDVLERETGADTVEEICMGGRDRLEG